LAFPVPIFTELTNAQQHYVPIPCGKFHPNQTTNTERSLIKTFISLSVAFIVLVFFKLSENQYAFMDSSCTEFYPNPMKNAENMGSV